MGWEDGVCAEFYEARWSGTHKVKREYWRWMGSLAIRCNLIRFSEVCGRFAERDAS